MELFNISWLTWIEIILIWQLSLSIVKGISSILKSHKEIKSLNLDENKWYEEKEEFEQNKELWRIIGILGDKVTKLENSCLAQEAHIIRLDQRTISTEFKKNKNKKKK